jgi:hypothetical protein
MNETDLPERRPMPEGLRDRLWAELEPQLTTRASDGRFRTMRAPLAVAASVVVLAAGVAIALPHFRGHGNGEPVIAVAGSPGDVPLVNECIQADPQGFPPGSWRAGARIDLDPENGFLMIRNDESAVVCVLKNGKGTGLVHGLNGFSYGAPTAARPFAYLGSWNQRLPATVSVHFGIAAGDVTAVSIVGPDKSVTPAILRDGTFLAKTTFVGASNQLTTARIRATLKNGQVIEGPFR